jgi:APA family basic amino acid/polyamine antiporter
MSYLSLKRALNLFDSVAIGIGAMIGAGIFVVTGIAAGLAGPAVIFSIIIAGAVSSLTALSFAELSSAIPLEGGAYQFVYKVVSHDVGFLAGWLWLFSNIVAGSAISMGLASYLNVLLPALPIRPVAVLACLLFAAVNVVGVKQSSLFNNALVVFKVLVLVIFVGLGILYLKPSNFSPLIPNGFAGILQGSSIIFFAYAGFARITTISEEVRNPEKTIPRAILISMVVTSILYITTASAAIGLISFTDLASSSSPIAAAAGASGVSWTVTLISLGAVAATASVLLTIILGLSRVFYAMSRNKEFPATLSRVHGKLGTPYISILIMGGVMASLTMFADLGQVIALSNFGSLLYYALSNLAAVLLRRRLKDIRGGFRTPLYPLIPIIGMATCLLLLLTLDIKSWIIGAFAVGIGVIYLLAKRMRR